MASETRNPVKGQRTCPRCGALFVCGLAAGEARCWCFDLPNVIPLSSLDVEGCLCPDCLRAAIEMRDSREYPRTSWVDPRIEVKPSRLGGMGMFATTHIKEGETVVIWGGALFTEAEIAAGKAKPGSVAAVDEGVYLAGTADKIGDLSDYMNHSCDPNVWMSDAVTLVARRDIAAGEELTADYALWEADEEWIVPWECNCGAPDCRKRITGKDWRLKTLQERYKGHFSPFINRRIERSGSA